MKSGIYCIQSILSKKVYIGQSVDVKRRLQWHECLLKKNKHENSMLQNYCNKYWIHNLEFKIIEKCSIDLLDEREIFWINKFDSMKRNLGFNRESGGNLGKKYSEERILSLTGKCNPMYGKKWTDSQREKIVMANRGNSKVLNESDVNKIKENLANGISQSEIAKKYNVKFSTINKIMKCVNWSWVSEHLNEKLINYSSVKKQKKINNIQEVKLKKINNDKIKNEIYKKVLIDYEHGMEKGLIIKKHGISNTTYIRITSKLHNQKKEKLKNDIINLKNNGLTGKEIAARLNIHTCTVTEYLKKYMPESLKKYTKNKSC